MASAVIADSDVRTLSSQACPSITGKSKLTYHLGMHGSKPVIRIHSNTGPGFFNDEWIDVSKVIDTLPKAGPFTSFTLRVVFKGRSMNSRAFLMAALRNEGVVQRSTEKPRCWERADIDAFLAKFEVVGKSSSPALSQPSSRMATGEKQPKPASKKPVAKPAAPAPTKGAAKPKR